MHARVFSPFRLNPMGHIVSPECLDQLSPITLWNRFCGSGIAGVTSQDFNKGIVNNSLGIIIVVVVFSTENTPYIHTYIELLCTI